MCIMNIVSNQIEIKPFTPDMAHDFYELSHDSGFTLFPITDYTQTSIDSARNWIHEAIALNQKTNLGKWAVFEKSTGSLIGMGGLTPWKLGEENLVDITYRLRQSAWGRGYGQELAQLLVNYGFNELGLSQITATITPDNMPSKKIAEKLGMKFDQRIILLGVPTDLYRLFIGLA